jgi:hypothetical protein
MHKPEVKIGNSGILGASVNSCARYCVHSILRAAETLSVIGTWEP